jgi:quercetin dioxygenase-like cupin family protein
MDIKEQLDQAGIEVIHHWATGLYSKEMRIPAGAMLGKHVHDFDHFSFLLSGSVSVSVDGEASVHTAPALLVIEAGKEHVIRALTDTVWHCTHATTETDPDKVDDVLKGEA